MKRFTLVWTTLLFLFFFNPLWAQEDSLGKNAGSDQQLSLEEIIVQDQKPQKKIALNSISAPTLGKFGHDIEIITGKEMEEAGFVDLARALESMVPGLFSSTSQGRGGYNIIRIHGSNQILWLLDGVRINAIHGALSHPWSYTLSVHMIDHVEVLKGGEGLFYGTGARGGVINIITKDVTQEATGQFGTSFGEDQYREVYGHVSETFDGHGLMAFASQESYEGYNVLDDQAYAAFGNTYGNKSIGSDRTTGGVKYRREFKLAGTSVLNAQYRRQTGYFDYPNANQRTSRFDWNEDVTSLKWDHDVNKNFSYHFTTYLHRWWAELTQQKIDGSFLFDHEPVECEAYGINFMTSTRWGQGHEIVSGLDYRNYWGSFAWAYGSDYDRVKDYGFFASFRPYLGFSPDTKLALSGRYTLTSEDAKSFVWDASLKTPITGPTYIRGSIRTDFTLPTMGQTSMRLDGYVGNPDLEPEESFDIQAGIGGDWKYLRCYAGYFYNKVENLIQREIITSGADAGDTTYKNVEGETKINGVEISAGIGPFSGVSLDANATWTNAEDGDTGEQLEQIPEFNASINLRYRNKTGRYGGDLMTRYTGDIYERGLGSVADINYGNYFVTDASVFVTLGREKRHRVTLRMENIFDEDYANGYGRSRASSGDYYVFKRYGLPRNVVLGYTYTF